MPPDIPKRPDGRTPLPLIRLGVAPGSTGVATAAIRVTIGGEPMQLAITVPSGPAQVGDLLPVFRGLADVVAGVGVRKVERAGARVSCRAGCGACCRQPVPVSESEARAIKQLVDGMLSRGGLRFGSLAQTVRRLAESGLLDQVCNSNPGSDVVALGLDYFRLGLPCPFLEEESCSIHPDRPVACREYLVTSPPQECGRPDQKQVCGVPLPAQVGRAVRAVDRQASGSGSGWVLLVLALKWAEAHPEGPARSGPELLRGFFSSLVGEAGLSDEGARPPDGAEDGSRGRPR